MCITSKDQLWYRQGIITQLWKTQQRHRCVLTQPAAEPFWSRKLWEAEPNGSVPLVSPGSCCRLHCFPSPSVFPQTNILSNPSSPQKPPGLVYLISKQKISARMPICPFSWISFNLLYANNKIVYSTRCGGLFSGWLWNELLMFQIGSLLLENFSCSSVI